MAQLDVCPTCDHKVMGLTPAGRQHSLMEIDHEIFSTVILSLLQIVSFWGKNVHNTG